MDTATIFIILIPFLIPLVFFIILIRKGITRSVLIASLILAAIAYIASASQGNGLIVSLFNSVPGFFLWYCIIEGIRRFVTRKRSKEGMPLK